jgi:3D (Asp-Asp-Asp) domain-containing protein
MQRYLSALFLLVFATSYNPVASQTSGSPCTGASGRDLCVAAREGDRTIAVSRDLLLRNGGPLRWYDKVRLESDNPSCAGIYSVEDTMSPRFRSRVDLFFLTRTQNTSCSATLTKL